MKNERINYAGFGIAKEILPLLKIRMKIMRKGLFGGAASGGGRILVVNACIIGDFLSYLPALRCYTKENGFDFDILVTPTTRPLAEKLKGVKRVFVAASSGDQTMEQARRERQKIPREYDLIIVLRANREAYELIKDVRCAKIISSDAAFFKYLFHIAKSSLLKRQVKQSREVIFETLGLNGVDKNCELYDLFDFGGPDYDFVHALPEMDTPEKKILIHTGSGWKIKLWKNEKWAELLTKIRALGEYRFIFVGGTETEKEDFERVQKNLNFTVYSLINKVNLRELFLLMKKSDYFIGIDSGPRNLAHFADLRSISLLNPAAVRNFLPFSQNDIVVEKPNRFPANLVNLQKKSNMEAISADEVFEAFKKLSKAKNAAEVPLMSLDPYSAGRG